MAASAEGLVSSINEVAASIEQVTSATDTLAGGIRQVAASMQESNASIHSVTGTAQGVPALFTDTLWNWSVRSPSLSASIPVGTLLSAFLHSASSSAVNARLRLVSPATSTAMTRCSATIGTKAALVACASAASRRLTIVDDSTS